MKVAVAVAALGLLLLGVAALAVNADLFTMARNDAGLMVNLTLPSQPTYPDPMVFADVVTTTNGPIRGYTDRGVNIWRGVPFAAPPVGDLRLRSSRPPTPWIHVKDTVAQQHICPQFRLTDAVHLGNEDCLYLDVYAPPYVNGSALRPVMVWLFGGGYVFGDGWEFGFYDGFNLVHKHGYILVAPNYRLGPLGFMALDGLRAEDTDSTTGNYGLHDQRLALKWVQQNIAKFGGDASKVTIFGESAGGFSVCYHVASPGSKGLFRSAIMESGTCDSPDFFRPYAQAQLWSKTYARMAGCDPDKEGANLVPCLRKLSTGRIMGDVLAPKPPNPYGGFLPRLFPIMPWGPAIDGTQAALPDLPLKIIQRGQHNNVTFIGGHNKDEGTIFILAAPIVAGVMMPFTEQSLNETFAYFFKNSSAQTFAFVMDNIWKVYPKYQYKTLGGLGAAVLRDYVFTCSTRRAMQSLAAQGSASYMYHFTYTGDWIDQMALGDYHASELFFVFANEWPPLLHIYSQRDRTMSETFGTYWSNMAWYGNPNGNSTAPGITWPRFDSTTLRNVVLDVPARVEENLGASQCAFWDEVYARGG